MSQHLNFALTAYEIGTKALQDDLKGASYVVVDPKGAFRDGSLVALRMPWGAASLFRIRRSGRDENGRFVSPGDEHECWTFEDGDVCLTPEFLASDNADQLVLGRVIGAYHSLEIPQ